MRVSFPKEDGLSPEEMIYRRIYPQGRRFNCPYRIHSQSLFRLSFLLQSFLRQSSSPVRPPTGDIATVLTKGVAERINVD